MKEKPRLKSPKDDDGLRDEGKDKNPREESGFRRVMNGIASLVRSSLTRQSEPS